MKARLSPYTEQIKLGLYVFVIVSVVYSIYVMLFPPPDRFEQIILTNARHATELGGFQKRINVPITTGGEYSFQTWIYISDWTHRAGMPKHIFSIAGSNKSGTSNDHVTMVGILYPNENKMMIRVHQDPNGTVPTTGPDMTLLSNISNLFSTGQIDGQMYGNASDFPICDIMDLDLQKWINLAITVNGRVVDVYVDGKLARSCVCPNIPTVVNSHHQYVVLGQSGGWGGSISTTRVFGYALTPAQIYQLYQVGPADGTGLDGKYGFLGFLLERIGIRIDYQGLNSETTQKPLPP
jgi:hypothetical protein